MRDTIYPSQAGRFKPVPVMEQEYRVRALLRFPFSPAIRRLTVQSLLNDPATHDLTRAFLTPDVPV
jgi:hypothetical protein